MCPYRVIVFLTPAITLITFYTFQSCFLIMNHGCLRACISATSITFLFELLNFHIPLPIDTLLFIYLLFVHFNSHHIPFCPFTVLLLYIILWITYSMCLLFSVHTLQLEFDLHSWVQVKYLIFQCAVCFFSTSYHTSHIPMYFVVYILKISGRQP